MKTNWSIDPSHSEITFKVKHLVISTVTGSFTKYDVKAETDGDDFTSARIFFSADVNSITTGNEQRDGHLKSPDFFDAETHPLVTFVSNTITKSGDDQFNMSGDLTMRGVTKAIDLQVEFGGTMKDPWGNLRAGFEISGKINRKEFGLHWSAATETGGLVVSDEVKLLCHVELIKGA
ncbi:MAG: YceI family protein [Bacteroidetes bacterium]|nr:MAG: YceI family protein [Bacteroidota bacterium]